MINLSDNQPSLLSPGTRTSPSAKQTLTHPSSNMRQWMYDITKWINIIERWEKEGRLLLKLVEMTRLGQNKIESLDRAKEDFNRLFEQEIDKLKSELLDLCSKRRKMAVNTLFYQRKIESYRQLMRKIAQEFDAQKHQILEELTYSYPLTII